jgi:MYXO-CTERM domain-containing protein
MALVALFISSGRAVAVVELRAEGVTVDAPGDVAQLCVSLDSGGAEVAGTQNDLVWDGSCATLPNSASCEINPATGKQLQGGFPPQFDFTFRALVLSLADVDPIPDGPLYCCSFTVEGDPGTCCPVELVRVGASDPRGTALSTSANTAQLCVAGAGTPVPTRTPIPGGGGEDDGCQVSGRRDRGVPPTVLVIGLVALAALRRRRRD